MNLSYFFTVIVLGLSVVSVQAQSTNAAPINTVPEGITTFNIPATGVGSTTTSYFSAPLVNDPIYTGAVATVGLPASGGTVVNTITVGDSPPPWTSTTLGVTPPYFVKFLSGNEVGRILAVLSNTASSLTLDITDNTSQSVPLNATNFAVEPGDTFEVFAGDTLGLMFGVNTTQSPLILTGGNILSADSVSIYSPTQNRFLSYYFSTSAGYWEQVGNTANANNTVIRPYTGFLITRRSGEAATSFVLTGRVAEVNHLVKVTGSGAAIYDSSGYPVDVTLGQLQLGSNWTKGGLINADTVSIWDAAANKFDSYYEQTNNTWIKIGGGTTDQSSVVIPAATTISFTKRASVSGNTSYVAPVMPYSLTN